MMSWCLTIITFILLTFDSVQPHHESDDVVFYVKHERLARELARKHGLDYISEVFPGSNYHHAVIKKENLDPVSHIKMLSSDPRVSWYERQTYQPRELRLISSLDRVSRFTSNANNPSSGLEFNDPQYPLQWYLHGMNGDGKHHLNVTAAWNQGLSGKGVAIAVLDDNVNPYSPEIEHNYDPEISGDLGETTGPGIKKNPVHGTYCAAVIAAEANNSFCGVGVAFRARIGGVRLLAKKKVLDVQEARALNYKLGNVDIYSASWGPPDDGAHIGGPGVLGSHALERGVKLGRGGLGAIYIWASGNGGHKGDNCAYDNFASNIYTLTVSSLTPEGLSPYYAEPCPALLTSLYVGGNHEYPTAYTNNVDNVVVPEGIDGCQNQFQGTSAAAPLAAGIVALLLEANPRLTWRDVQHLVVLNSFPPTDSSSWSVNGAGLRSNVLYGFGALNAGRLIAMGRGWKSVPSQVHRSVPCPVGPIELPAHRTVQLTLNANHVPITSLEYVSISVSLDVKQRGTLTITLQSPSGMVSPLLVPRPKDSSTDGLSNWNLTTSQFWNENPAGQWQLSLTNPTDKGLLDFCSMHLFGY